VSVDIRPEPDDRERAALLRALEQEAAGASLPPAYRSPWRRAGLLESARPAGEPVLAPSGAAAHAQT
jgi:hypothetical protein